MHSCHHHAWKHVGSDGRHGGDVTFETLAYVTRVEAFGCSVQPTAEEVVEEPLANGILLHYLSRALQVKGRLPDADRGKERPHEEGHLLHNVVLPHRIVDEAAAEPHKQQTQSHLHYACHYPYCHIDPYHMQLPYEPCRVFLHAVSVVYPFDCGIVADSSTMLTLRCLSPSIRRQSCLCQQWQWPSPLHILCREPQSESPR